MAKNHTLCIRLKRFHWSTHLRISSLIYICINMFCFVNLDVSILTPQLTIGDLQQTKVTTRPNVSVGNRIKHLICIVKYEHLLNCEIWKVWHSCFHNLSADLHETSQEAAEGCGGFEEEACEGDRRLLFPWVHWIDYEHFAGVSRTLKPVGLENWQHGHKDNPASHFRHTLHCRAPTALKWTGLLLNMIKRSKRWRSNSKKAARKWGECDISFSLRSSLYR